MPVPSSWSDTSGAFQSFAMPNAPSTSTFVTPDHDGLNANSTLPPPAPDELELDVDELDEPPAPPEPELDDDVDEEVDDELDDVEELDVGVPLEDDELDPPVPPPLEEPPQATSGARRVSAKRAWWRLSRRMIARVRKSSARSNRAYFSEGTRAHVNPRLSLLSRVSISRARFATVRSVEGASEERDDEGARDDEGGGASSARAGERTLSPRLAWLVAAVLAPAFLVKVKDYDVWWHLATGRFIARHHALPTTDPFTYTMQGKPWHLVNGLAELALYGVYAALGDAGLVLLKAVLACVVLGLVGLSLREVKASKTTSIAVVASIALLVHARFTMERPLLFGAALLAGCQLAALRSLLRRDRSHVVFLVALPLWPLVHATALLGLAQLGALLVAAVVAKTPKKHLVSIGATFAASLAIAALCPWWRDAVRVAFELGAGATATRFTAEWRTGAEALEDRVGHWGLLLVAAIGGAATLRKNALLLLTTLVGAAAAWAFARNAYEALLLAAPAFAVGLELGASKLREAGRAIFARAFGPIVAATLAVAQLAIAPSHTIGGPFGFGVVREPFPFDTVKTLEKLPVHRLFNDFPIGGWLIFRDGPWGVYCDGRTVALYGEDDVRRLFVPQMQGVEELTKAADAWDAPYGLNQNGSPPNQWMMISKEWVPLHVGLGTTLFVRATKVKELPPDVRPLHLVRFADEPAWTKGYYQGLLKDPELRAQFAIEFAEAARLSPESPVLVDILRAIAEESPPYAAGLEKILQEARAKPR